MLSRSLSNALACAFCEILLVWNLVRLTLHPNSSRVPGLAPAILQVVNHMVL